MSKFELIEGCATQRTAVVVLGGDGLAASAISKLLASLGCDAPASEEHGTSKFAEFNSEILASTGTLPNHWAGVNTRWLGSPKATEFVRRALELMQTEFGSSYLSVMHDTCTSRLLPFWNRAFDRAGVLPRYLFVISDPAEIADDLHERFGIEQRAGHLIWLRAALDAEANSRGRLRAFVQTAQLIRDPARTVNSFAESLNLIFPRDVQSTFASKDARLKQFRELVRLSKAPSTSGAGAPVTAEWVIATHQILRDWASNGETEEARSILDAIREAFDEAVPAFLGIEQSADRENSEVRDLEQALESAREEVNELRKANRGAQEDLQARYGEIVTLTRMLATETSAARKFERRAQRLGGIARVLERGATRSSIAGWLDRILPWRWHLKRIKRKIEREGLFDPGAYLTVNPDVQKAGVDPLRHYLAHGASEDRPLGID